MTRNGKTSDAVQILHSRYVKDDPERQASISAERINAQVARMIYDLRNEAGLTQQELADLVGTTQSVISRLEDADYGGHSLSMLNRIAEALEQKVTVVMTSRDPKVDEMQHAFHLFLQMLRRRHGFTVDALAQRAGVDRDEIAAIERNHTYRPSALTLRRLCRVYGIPERRMLVLAGAIQDAPQTLSERASRFATQADGFTKLTQEQRKTLDEFVQFMREEN